MNPTHGYRCDMAFGSKYLSQKYVLSMCSKYVKEDIEEFAQLFKVLSDMPFEFFTNSPIIIFKDSEALDASQALLQKLGKDKVYENLTVYFSDIFEVKALLQAIPRF